MIHPLTVLGIMANTANAAITMRQGLHDPSKTQSVACATSDNAIGEVNRAIRHDFLDTVTAVDTKAMLNPYATSPTNHHPFSIDRARLVIGECTAALVLKRPSPILPAQPEHWN